MEHARVGTLRTVETSPVNSLTACIGIVNCGGRKSHLGSVTRLRSSARERFDDCGLSEALECGIASPDSWAKWKGRLGFGTCGDQMWTSIGPIRSIYWSDRAQSDLPVVSRRLARPHRMKLPRKHYCGPREGYSTLGVWVRLHRTRPAPVLEGYFCDDMIRTSCDTFGVQIAKHTPSVYTYFSFIVLYAYASRERSDHHALRSDILSKTNLYSIRTVQYVRTDVYGLYGISVRMCIFHRLYAWFAQLPRRRTNQMCFQCWRGVQSTKGFRAVFWFFVHFYSCDRRGVDD